MMGQKLKIDYYLLKELSINDFKKKYFGSYLGVIWPFLNPLVTIMIFWFVFDVGLKAKPVDNAPFVLWLSVGMIPWFFFSESILSGGQSLLEYSFLIKKVTFQLSLIPLIKIFSSFVIHFFLVCLLIFLSCYYGYYPSWHWLQLIYYALCLMTLVISMTIGLSALTLFIKDIPNVLSMMMQFGFWMTPIMWNIEMISKEWRIFFNLNPLFYIVSGFRDTFIFKRYFWELPLEMSIFWGVTISIFIFSATIFRRMRPHFGDML